MNFEPTGTVVYHEASSRPAGSAPANNADLLVPKMDKFPILPDAGHFTDIVSVGENTPWFDHARPDIRPEVVESSCHN